MILLEIVLLSIILILLGFVFISLLTSRGSTDNLKRGLFSGIILTVVVWVISILVTDLNFNNHIVALWASRVSFFSSAIIAFLYFLFIKSFSKLKFSLDLLIITLATAIFSVFSMTDLVLRDVELISTENLKSHFGEVYSLFGIFIFLTFVYSIILFYRRYKKEKDLIQKAQIQNILVGSAVSIFIITTTNLVFPNIGLPEIRSLGPLNLIFFLGFTYYSILRYRFLSVNLIIGRVIYTLLIGLFPYSVFFFFYYFQTIVWGSIFSVPALISGFILSIFVVYLFLITNKSLLSIINKKIINREFNPSEAKDKLSKQLSLELNTQVIIQKFVNLLKETIRPNFARIIVFDSNQQCIVDESSNSIEMDNVSKNLLFSLFNNNNNYSLIVYEELLHSNIKDHNQSEELLTVMKKYNIALISDINLKSDRRGILLLGQKIDNTIYSVQDLDFVNSLISIFSVALGRALLYLQVQDFANNLQQKVEEATKEIIKQKEEIEEQLRKEKDMMDILGHELRTPLSIARNAISILDMQIKNEPSEVLSKAKVKASVDWAMENIRREVKILETVLSSTRIENNRLQLTITDVDCIDVVNDAVNGLKETAIDKKLELKAEIPSVALSIKGDREKIQEIIFNLVDNAIKYTTKGGVIVRLEDLGKEVKFSVIDTGEGIPKEDIPNLGKKFFRSRMYLDSSENNDMKVVRPGGTGIGLYVVFNLVKLMNGRIEIESEVNKGSTFKVYLPKI